MDSVDEKVEDRGKEEHKEHTVESTLLVELPSAGLLVLIA